MTPNDIAYSIDRRRKRHLQRQEVDHLMLFRMMASGLALSAFIWTVLFFAVDGFLHHFHNVLSRDERGRLHSISGPAVMYPDGWAIYAIHGVRIPADIIEQPESVTPERIEKEENAEIRRVMIERMGYERYILESGAQVVHSDDIGILYRKEIPGDEPLVVVHVVNSTPEPDGSLKKYMLRVPPDMKTARGAIAWTFGLRENEYRPLIQT